MTIQTAVASIEEHGRTTTASCTKQEMGEVCTSVAVLVSCCCSSRFYSAEEKDAIKTSPFQDQNKGGRGVVTENCWCDPFWNSFLQRASHVRCRVHIFRKQMFNLGKPRCNPKLHVAVALRSLQFAASGKIVGCDSFSLFSSTLEKYRHRLGVTHCHRLAVIWEVLSLSLTHCWRLSATTVVFVSSEPEPGFQLS